MSFLKTRDCNKRVSTGEADKIITFFQVMRPHFIHGLKGEAPSLRLAAGRRYYATGSIII